MNQRNQNVQPLFRNTSEFKRQIRINEDLSICDVFSIRRGTRDNDPSYQTTYQDPNIGRYIVIRNYDHPIKVVDLTRDPSDYFLPNEQAKKIIEKLPPIIIEWLNDISCAKRKHSNYIPAGYGWDGKFTRSEYMKRQRIENIINPYANINIDRPDLDIILDELTRTPKSLITTNWMYARPIPLDRFIKYTNSSQVIDFIFVYEDKSVLQTRKRIIGDVGKHPGMQIPNNVHRVIRLTHGVICNDMGDNCGIKLELFSDELI